MLRKLVGLTLAAGLSACPKDAPRAPEPLSALALAPLDVGDAGLLPRAVLDRPAVAVAPRDTPSIPDWDRPFLRGLAADKSYSIGTASRGYLVTAIPMPEDLPFLRPRPTAVRKDALWGTAEMVGLVVRVARQVADQWPGSELWAGDFSAQHGGDLSNHASHNSGRDVDLAFYMRDVAGRAADTARMQPIGLTGKAKWSALRFDVPRNWALVEAMVRDPHVQVQYVFVAAHLEGLMIAHAKAHGVDPKVIARASDVMREPIHAANHDDHFHVRLYCALHERVEGCVDFGVRHSWADRYDKALQARVDEVVPFLRMGGPDEVRYAVTRLVRLKARKAAGHLAPLLSHDDAEIRALASDAIAFLSGHRTPPRWSHLTDEDPGE